MACPLLANFITRSVFIEVLGEGPVIHVIADILMLLNLHSTPLTVMFVSDESPTNWVPVIVSNTPPPVPPRLGFTPVIVEVKATSYTKC